MMHLRGLITATAETDQIRGEEAAEACTFPASPVTVCRFHLTPRAPWSTPRSLPPRVKSKQGFTTWLLQFQPRKLSPPFWMPTIMPQSLAPKWNSVFRLTREVSLDNGRHFVPVKKFTSTRVAAGSPEAVGDSEVQVLGTTVSALSGEFGLCCCAVVAMVQEHDCL
jgi:hypothetical protein